MLPSPARTVQDTDVINLALDRRPNTSSLLPLSSYDHILVQFSGGKDSLAAWVNILEDPDCPRDRVELWHQHVDGAPGSRPFMDWPITEDYCRKVAAALGAPIFFQWRNGGFLREMLRDNQNTAAVHFQTPTGVGQAGGVSPKVGTRRRFPQAAADLRVRWCSSSLKIDVVASAICNDPRFADKRVLVITGERREESPNRARYAEVESHRTSNSRRRVDHWRPVIDWDEARVWDAIRRHKVNPHPAYRLGFSRVSCMFCIFGDRNQWATLRRLAPERFAQISHYEHEFQCTIKQGEDVFRQSLLGKSFVDAAPPELIALALGKEYTDPVFVEDWQMPAGAFKRCQGPS